MILMTESFGEIDLSKQDIYTFESGIPGFDGFTQFVILQSQPELPFYYLQSIDDVNLAFLITDPFVFYPDYAFDLPSYVLHELKIDNEEHVMTRSIVSIPNELENATINLMAPIIINRTSKLGKQIVLHDSGYATKHQLLRSNPTTNTDEGV